MNVYEKNIKQLEWELETKDLTLDFLIDQYKKVPADDHERKARYVIILKKHTAAITNLCDKLEDNIKLLITFLNLKKEYEN